MNPLVQPDPGLFIWTIVTFLVLLALLAKFAWQPLLSALDRRQEVIRKSLDDADRARQELERLQQESAQIIRSARADAEAVIAKGREDAEKVRDQIKQQAKEESDAILRNAQQQIQLQTREALGRIRREVADLSVGIASKLLERNVSNADTNRLIDETLKQIEVSSEKDS
jgi:F-type H+-transporting ATPase subunit b